MSNLSFLLGKMQSFGADQAIVWNDKAYLYSELLSLFEIYREMIEKFNIPQGAVVSLEADFSPVSIAIFLALIEKNCILVPLTTSVKSKLEEFLSVGQVEFRLTVENEHLNCVKTGVETTHSLYEKVKSENSPGLVLFSSGSTGKSKGALHNMIPLLKKFEVPRNKQRTISFLLFDHIGGINTMFYTLFNGGCIVTVNSRSPEAVLSSIEKWKVDLLPTSPTFLNILTISDEIERHDLRSLKLITYGTEPMPESTLRRVAQLLPNVNLLQTYGLSEIGIMRSKSKDRDSLWVKIGGEGFETRVVDGILQVKAQSAMLGYLNAPSPFSDDGWFITGDEVLVDGDYFRILGRKSELINVGGEKVYPAEVESCIQEMEEVESALVYGEKHPLTGQIVAADVLPKYEGASSDLVVKIRNHCAEKLARYKVPIKIKIVGGQQHSERFKKERARLA